MAAALTLDEVNEKLKTLIRAHQPISVRNLCQCFAAKHRIQVRGMIKLWAQSGELIITGTGRRNNPLVVRVNDSVTQ
jgi:hypothetical protein